MLPIRLFLIAFSGVIEKEVFPCPLRAIQSLLGSENWGLGTENCAGPKMHVCDGPPSRVEKRVIGWVTRRRRSRQSTERKWHALSCREPPFKATNASALCVSCEGGVDRPLERQAYSRRMLQERRAYGRS